MKPMTISLSDFEVARWRKLSIFAGDAWRFWKEVFSKHPQLKDVSLNGSENQILHIRYVGGNEFRVEYSDRKLPEKAIKALKLMSRFA